MMNSEESGRERGKGVFSALTLLIMFFSVVALISTFLLTVSTAGAGVKLRGFSGIIAVFIILASGLAYWQNRRRDELVEFESNSDANLERNLLALDEANEYFAGSLATADAIRLVASRLRMLVPHNGIALFLVDESQTQLEIAATDGTDESGKTAEFDEELADRCYATQEVATGNETGKLAAIPLRCESGVFGVLELSLDTADEAIAIDLAVLEAIGTRVAPLILSSIAFEQSHANALTDSTTDLPNERAFFLILENQIAEAQRKYESRPLTVLAMDIKNFDEINALHGHAAGDRVLNFVAQIVKDNLRQMDFFARAMNDEFLAVLPTATKAISHEIIARIHTGFFGRKLRISDEQSIEIELNVGWAAFGIDGETPDNLLSAARQRKEQTKSAQPPKVLWFSREVVN